MRAVRGGGRRLCPWAAPGPQRERNAAKLCKTTRVHKARSEGAASVGGPSGGLHVGLVFGVAEILEFVTAVIALLPGRSHPHLPLGGLDPIGRGSPFRALACGVTPWSQAPCNCLAQLIKGHPPRRAVARCSNHTTINAYGSAESR